MFEQMEAWRVIVLCVGGLAALIGMAMILSHGFRVLLWSLLVMIGAGAAFVAVGDQGTMDAAQLLSPLQDALESGAALGGGLPPRGVPAPRRVRAAGELTLAPA